MPGRHHHRRATTRLGLRLKSINPHDCLVLSDPRGGSCGRRCGEKRSMTNVVSWTARLWSIASVGLISFFIVGEEVKIARPSEWLLFLFFPIGVCCILIATDLI